MLTKKEKILIQPFIEQNYKKHRRKVQSAQPAIDFSRPADHMHVLVKLKKIQKERERMHEIERENQRLLQRLSQIMLENRLDNYWKEPHPNFLNRVYIKSSSSSASSSSKRRAQSVPPQPKKSIITNNEMTAMESYNQSNLRTLSKSRSCMRCPTCSGKAITTTNVVISEERVPFAPPRKSWNQKLINDQSKIHQCCKFCC